MSRSVSAQVHALQRLLSLGNEHPDKPGFPLDDVVKWPVFKKRGTPRESIRRALDRFILLDIVFSPGSSRSGKRLYRVRRSDWAMAYIAGEAEKPWIPLTPTPASPEFADCDEHRDHFDVVLTAEWFSRIRGACETNNRQSTFRTKAFTLSVNEKSLRGQIFIRPYWREEVKRRIGEDFYQYLANLDSKGALRGDFCLPIDVRGQRFFIGGRPTQFSASHYEAQLDVRTSKGDRHIRDGLAGLINQADFNTRTLDFQDAVLETLKKQGEAQSHTAEAIQKLVRFFFSQPERFYPSSSQDRRDFAYR